MKGVGTARESRDQDYGRSALGGYGGCPFGPGAHGNIDTQELVRQLHASGHETGVDERLLAEAVRLAREVVAKSPALEQKPAATR